MLLFVQNLNNLLPNQNEKTLPEIFENTMRTIFENRLLTKPHKTASFSSGSA